VPLAARRRAHELFTANLAPLGVRWINEPRARPTRDTPPASPSISALDALLQLAGYAGLPADRDRLPTQISHPPSPRKYWTRRGVTEWRRLGERTPTLIGIDRLSFPCADLLESTRELGPGAFKRLRGPVSIFETLWMFPDFVASSGAWPSRLQRRDNVLIVGSAALAIKPYRRCDPERFGISRGDRAESLLLQSAVAEAVDRPPVRCFSEQQILRAVEPLVKSVGPLCCALLARGDQCRHVLMRQQRATNRSALCLSVTNARSRSTKCAHGFSATSHHPSFRLRRLKWCRTYGAASCRRSTQLTRRTNSLARW
jgi:hypothetical protein